MGRIKVLSSKTLELNHMLLKLIPLEKSYNFTLLQMCIQYIHTP